MPVDFRSAQMLITQYRTILRRCRLLVRPRREPAPCFVELEAVEPRILLSTTVGGITLDHIAAYTFDGPDATDEFGRSVSGAGDVNNDGHDDLIVGSYFDDDAGTNAGSATIYSGLDGSVLHRFEGDEAGDFFGWSVSEAGDVNADGFADVIVGAPVGGAGNEGFARVFSGQDGSTLYTLNGDSSGDQLGWFVGFAGDVDADGFDDVIIGAPRDDNNGENSGSARVVSGQDGSELYEFNGDSADDGFGRSATGAGDVNGDGFDDLIVGAENDDNNGAGSGSARVLSGQDGSELYEFNGLAANNFFGFAVSFAGDINLDGFDDMIVAGTQGGANNGGYAQVLSGQDGSVLLTVDGKSDGDLFGRSVSAAGDVNNDGYPDLIVGATRDDNNGAESGSARIISGLDGSQLHEFSGDASRDFFGEAVSGAGDVNGDGIPDFIIGAPFGGANDGGYARVFVSDLTAPLATITGTVWEDLDSDGIQDAGENGVANVTVNLLDDLGNPVPRTTTTDANGDYTFEALWPDDYIVEFEDFPAGLGLSPQDIGGNDTLDSDPDPLTGRTSVVTVASGDTSTDHDAGLKVASSEITVEVNGSEIADGSDKDAGIDIGASEQNGTAAQVTITVRNDGDATLSLQTPDLPDGFTMAEALDSSIAPSGSDTFTIQIDTTSTGVFAGVVTIDSNDSNEGEYTFWIFGDVQSSTPATRFEPGDPAGTTGGDTQIVDDGGNHVMQLTEDNDSLWNDTINLPADAQSIVFDYQFTQPGTGDRLVALIDGVEAWAIVGSDAGTMTELVTAPPIDVSASAGGSITFELRLEANGANTGPDQAQVNVDNVVVLTELPAQLLAGSVFFDGSSFDSDADGDAASTLQKSLLEPGQTATAANYTSSSAGVTGLIFDFVNPDGAVDLSDFTFTTGLDNTPDDWAAAPDPTVDFQPGAGVGGTDRVLLTWSSADAIKDAWLEVTIHAGGNTGLGSEQVYYFGNIIGDVSGDGLTNATDVLQIWANRRFADNPATVEDIWDINKDGLTNATDVLQAWGARKFGGDAIPLITPGLGGAAVAGDDPMAPLSLTVDPLNVSSPADDSLNVPVSAPAILPTMGPVRWADVANDPPVKVDALQLSSRALSAIDADDDQDSLAYLTRDITTADLLR